jgi:starvation-inducible DNA-binding protein|tara:strand:- start:168 stop:620 length:453 start_codon:yes stop_codon:yes gene_type:complete
MDKLIQAMKIAFASEFAFYLKAHVFHWNVEGPDFNDFHQMFGDIYTEVYESIDSFAENIRKLDAYVPGKFQEMSMIQGAEIDVEVPPAMEMVAILLADNEKLTKLMGMVYKMADAAGEYGLANFLAERQDAHRKHGWMLRATLKQTGGIQ